MNTAPKVALGVSSGRRKSSLRAQLAGSCWNRDEPLSEEGAEMVEHRKHRTPYRATKRGSFYWGGVSHWDRAPIAAAPSRPNCCEYPIQAVLSNSEHASLSGSASRRRPPFSAVCPSATGRACTQLSTGTMPAFGVEESPLVLFQFLEKFFAFAWGKKAVGLKPMLAGVKVVITALESVKAGVRTTFQNEAAFYHQDLICPANG
jgi:hypothetical protein